MTESLRSLNDFNRHNFLRERAKAVIIDLTKKPTRNASGVGATELIIPPFDSEGMYHDPELRLE